jgi:ribokinase
MSNDDRKILCLGDVMVDVVARLAAPLATGSDAAASTTLHGGGSAANTACWLDSTGTAVALIARVGDDVLGAWSREHLGERVARLVSVDGSTPTGTCVVLVHQSGERTMIPDAGANATLRPDHLPAAEFVAGRHLHVSAYAFFGSARIAALRAMSMARSVGMTISVGAASSAPLRTLGADAFFGLVGTDVLLVANSTEARVLTGGSDTSAAALQLADRVGQAVVTDGPHDAIWCSSEGAVAEPVPRVDPADMVDTTGAGDAFAAGVLASYICGHDRSAALRDGHQLAALACRTVGARPAR